MNATGLLTVMILTVSACGNEDGLLAQQGEGADSQPEFTSLSEELVAGESDYYHCFAAGGCAAPALATSTRCLKDRDYQVTVRERDSDVVVLSLHGGHIEPDSSELAQALSSKYNYSLYDFSAHGSASCLGTLDDFDRLHITAANFDDPAAVRMVSRHNKAVAIHGYNHSRGNYRGTLCVGGANRAQVKAFIAAVSDRKAEFSPYTLRPVDAATAEPRTGADCSGIAGTARTNPVNRTASGSGGLQLEMSDEIKADLLNPDSRYSPLRSIFYGAVKEAMSN